MSSQNKAGEPRETSTSTKKEMPNEEKKNPDASTDKAGTKDDDKNTATDSQQKKEEHRNIPNFTIGKSKLPFLHLQLSIKEIYKKSVA